MYEIDRPRVSARETARDVVAAEHVAGGATVVSLRGEIDVLTAPALAERLDALTVSPRPDLVLDLRSIAFIDCAGLGVLCRARNRVLARRGRLRLISDNGCLVRLLRVAGLGGVFDVQPHLPHLPPAVANEAPSTASP
ncbi:STAS domain-containing protein [Streptomyces alanosinicus]|nr:STAS domain-containing protein [Streptomyces alanosinicus]